MSNKDIIDNSNISSLYDKEKEIGQTLMNEKKYNKIKIKNIPFPFNVISDKNMKSCSIIIFINIGYFHESQNTKYENYIKIILEIIFERKNKFNELFLKYNLKYNYNIDIEKTVVYFEFEYSGFELIITNFIKTIINIDNLLIKNSQNEMYKNISLANSTDSDYVIYKKFIETILLNNCLNNKNEIFNNRKELNLEEFFHYYFLKNENINITVLLPYSVEKCDTILNNIFYNLKYEIKNKVIRRYEKYKEKTIINSSYFNFNEPSLLISSVIDLSKNNILKLKFLFPFLTYENQTILEYFIYMLKGKKPGSLYHDLFQRQFISDLNIYINYNISTPTELIIQYKLYNIFPMHNLTIIISKTINFLNKLKNEKNLITITYNNFEKLLHQKYIFKKYDKDNNYINFYDELYNITYNSIILNNQNKKKDNSIIDIFSYKYNLPTLNIDLIEQIINEISSLNNLFIIFELFPKSFTPFIRSVNFLKMNMYLLKNTIQINEYNTYILAKMNKEEILKYANTTRNMDNPMFNPKQDKNNYISNINNLIKNNYNNIINNNIQIVLNTISNKLWYKVENDIKYPKIYSCFHIIHPNIRNNIYNVYKTNLKFFNHLKKQIETEFEELYDINNFNFNNDYYINLTNDENGINLEINTFKDVYLKIIKKIFEFFFKNNFQEILNTDYFFKTFKDDISRAIYHLKQVIKKDIDENYFESINTTFSFNDIQTYANEICQNMYIEGLLYGDLDFDIVKEVRNMLFLYNSREYDDFCFFTDVPEFKNKIYEYKVIKEGNIYIYRLRQSFNDRSNLSYYLSFYQVNDCNNINEFFIIIIYILLKINVPECEVYKIYTDKIYYLLFMRSGFDNPEFSAYHASFNIKKFIDIICNKSNIELKKIILGIKEDLRKEINNIENKFNYIWHGIYYDKYNFEEYDQLKDYYNKYFSSKNKTEFEWLNDFKTFLKDNLFDKQRKVEFLFYKNSLHFPFSKDNNRYPYNFYNNYSLNFFTYSYLFYINEEK